MKKILIITSSFDYTTNYVVENYGDIADFYRFNVDQFEDYNINIYNSGWEIICDKWKLQKKDLCSIYYRKPSVPNLDKFQSEYRVMIAKDIISIVNGIADEFYGRVLSRPSVLRRAENKVLQLLYAARKNFLFPGSYIGNSAEIANNLFDSQMIIKPITTGKLLINGQTELYHTMYFHPIKEQISLMPVYVQKYTEKKYEVRLTFIDNQVFPIRIDSNNKLDWRMDYAGNTYQEIELPQYIYDACKSMLDEFGLAFGAFDFIVDKNDEWVFLEVNPNGQWLWLECACKLPISKSIVSYLLGVDKEI